MSLAAIIKEAKELHTNHNLQEEISLKLFTNGARWLHQYHNLILNEVSPFPRRAYEFYGWLKYGLSTWVFFMTLALWWHMGISALIGAIFGFYWIEFHFLFLFPLAIDSQSNLWFKTIKATYKFGFVKSFLFTIRIAFYMLSGFFDYKKPFHKWRIGCLTVLILYHNEIRDRV